MKRMISLALTLALTIGTPATLLAKAPIVKITITGPYLTAPLEITDFKNFDVNVWSGPGAQMNGKEQTEGFIIDWPLGRVSSYPAGLPHYEVSFYTEGGLVYVVDYMYDRSSKQGLIYLPPKGDKRFDLNCATICRGDGFDGHMFYATAAWNDAIRPLLMRAKEEELRRYDSEEVATTQTCQVSELVQEERMGLSPWYVNKNRTIWAHFWTRDPLKSDTEYKVIWIRPEPFPGVPFNKATHLLASGQVGTEFVFSGRRLDHGAPPLHSLFPVTYAQDFQPSGVWFPTAGCWEIKATSGAESLRFVVSVSD